jgi:tRNA(adenine34) deaminase
MNSYREQFMRRCLQLAHEARRDGNPGVGAILVDGTSIVSEGVEGSADLPPLLAHAEILAIIKAVSKLDTNDLSRCTLYTTVEPCYMCSYLIRTTGIREVVFGTTAGAVGGATSNHPILNVENIGKWSAKPLVIGGILEAECRLSK